MMHVADQFVVDRKLKTGTLQRRYKVGNLRFFCYDNAHFFYISSLVAKASGLNLGKKLSDLLSSREALRL